MTEWKANGGFVSVEWLLQRVFLFLLDGQLGLEGGQLGLEGRQSTIQFQISKPDKHKAGGVKADKVSVSLLLPMELSATFLGWTDSKPRGACFWNETRKGRVEISTMYKLHVL
jgi:hypothetical protein